MKTFYNLKAFVLLSFFLSALLVNAQVDKILIVVGGNVDEPNPEDQVMIDSLENWGLEIVYLYMDDFNNALIEDLYEQDGYGAEGVIISESINSASVGNFALDEYPVPCIAMEGVFTNDPESTEKWPLLLEDGGIWGYGTPDAVDVQWKIVETQHYITENFSNGDIVNYAPEEGRGVPYIHGFEVPHQVLAVAARTNGGDVAGFVQDDAIAMAELPDQEILYMNVAYTYLATATEEFYDLFHRGVEYMFDAYTNTGLKKVQTDHLKLDVYPNPVQNNVSVKYTVKSNDIAQLSILNLAGQEVYTESRPSKYGINTFHVELDQLTKGIYVVSLRVNKDVSYKKLFIK